MDKQEVVNKVLEEQGWRIRFEEYTSPPDENGKYEKFVKGLVVSKHGKPVPGMMEFNDDTREDVYDDIYEHFFERGLHNDATAITPVVAHLQTTLAGEDVRLDRLSQFLCGEFEEYYTYEDRDIPIGSLVVFEYAGGDDSGNLKLYIRKAIVEEICDCMNHTNGDWCGALIVRPLDNLANRATIQRFQITEAFHIHPANLGIKYTDYMLAQSLKARKDEPHA